MTLINSTSNGSSFCWVVLLSLQPSIFIHIVSFGIYLHPLTSAPTPSLSVSSALLYTTSKGKDTSKGDGNEQQRQEWPLIYTPQPQLDELHIMSVDNHDISPPAEPKHTPPRSSTTKHSSSSSSSSSSSWTNAWKNDYWGRALSSDSSHKSWRPMTVWSFRFLKGGKYGKYILATIGKLVGGVVNSFFGFGEHGVRKSNNFIMHEVDVEKMEAKRHQQQQYASELYVHRFINVIIHAAIVQLVGSVAMLLFRDDYDDDFYLPSSGGSVHKIGTPTTFSYTTTTTATQQLLSYYTKYISQLLFAIHPTHVECVVNAANRPHILALLFNVTIVDPTSVPMVAMAILAILGLLAAETALFHYPAIVFTMTAIRYNDLKSSRSMRKVVKKQEKATVTASSSSSLSSCQESTSPSSSSSSILFETIISLLPRYALLVLISATYLTYRYCSDTLSIPDGLIRPAENPFYEKAYNHQNDHHQPWTLAWRLINYSYIVSLHIMKSFGVEIVGYSHEYGYDCIPEIMQSSRDWRLVLPMMLTLLLGWIAAWSWNGGLWKDEATQASSYCSRDEDHMWKKNKKRKDRHGEERIERVLLCLVYLSWMATLLPISGFLKVGTFVADRIVVASTFGTCIFVGRVFALGIVGGGRNKNDDNKQFMSKTAISHVIVLCLVAFHLSSRTHHRASEWMDSVPLLESSLKACPRSIKSNLEMSKIYSGLVPHMLDLDRALSLINTAQSIDPTYCDVHQQYAHVYFQQEKFIDFEEETVNALLCKFTMGQAMNNWNRYWEVVLRHDDGGTRNIRAKERYNRYMTRIKDAVAQAKKKQDEMQVMEWEDEGEKSMNKKGYGSSHSSGIKRRTVMEEL